MLARQQRQMLAFLRMSVFASDNVPPGANDKYAQLVNELNELVDRLDKDAHDQAHGQHNAEAKTQQVIAAKKALRDFHLKPIAATARVLMSDAHEEVKNATRLPARNLGMQKLLAEAKSIREAVVKYEKLFIENGRSQDFIAQLDRAVSEVEQRYLERHGPRALRAGSTAGLAQDIRRARRLVTLIECQILTGYARDPVKLKEWQMAKRVHGKPGPKREPGEDQAS